MNVLVFNCGSSSLKYRMIAMPDERELCSGEAQRVGPATAEPARIVHRTDGREEIVEVDMPDHSVAFDEVMKLLTRETRLVPDAFGHRMVHGGTLFAEATVADDVVVAQLETIAHLAPLHNPPAMKLLHACREKRGDLPQVCVFDTAFHATIPDYAATYALPRGLREKLGLRKYGFHGTSHEYVVEEAATFLDKPVGELNAVSCHLGSGGVSLCAVVQGRSVDNTMGYSPLQGLVMSTRCGDLDPAVTLSFLRQADGRTEPVEKLLNKQSGVLGLSGVSADIRDVFADIGAGGGGTRTGLAAQVYLWRMRKYLGAYLTVVGDVDAVIFTDTIGETVPLVRWTVCTDMDAFGLKMDAAKNARVTSASQLPADLSTPDSAVRILAIATNEELAIARRTYAALTGATTR